MNHAAVWEYALRLADTGGKPALAVAVSVIAPVGCPLMPSRLDLPGYVCIHEELQDVLQRAPQELLTPGLVQKSFQCHTDGGHAVLLGVGDMTDYQVRLLLTTRAPGGSRRRGWSAMVVCGNPSCHQHQGRHASIDITMKRLGDKAGHSVKNILQFRSPVGTGRLRARHGSHVPAILSFCPTALDCVYTSFRV